MFALRVGFVFAVCTQSLAKSEMFASPVFPLQPGCSVLSSCGGKLLRQSTGSIGAHWVFLVLLSGQNPLVNAGW